MGLVLRLKGVSFNNPKLPPLRSDYPAQSLQVLYRMSQDIIGDVILDDSGNNNHGVNSGASKIDEGYNFSGASIDTGKVLGEESTMFAVVKMEPGDSRYQFLFSAYPQSSQLFFTGNVPDAPLNALHDNSDGASHVGHDTGLLKSTLDDKWLFVAMSTKVGRQITYIPQGDIEMLTESPGAAPLGGGPTLKVGAVGNGSYDEYFGDMAVFGYYDRSLSLAELRDVYNAARDQVALRGITLDSVL